MKRIALAVLVLAVSAGFVLVGIQLRQGPALLERHVAATPGPTGATGASPSPSTSAVTGPTGVTGPTPSPSSSSSAPVIFGRVTQSIAVGGTTPEGAPVTEDPAPSSLSPHTSGDKAVDLAWQQAGDLHPTAIHADFGLMEGVPNWFVTFDGICFELPIPPGVDPSDMPCATHLTVQIDDTNGQFFEMWTS